MKKANRNLLKRLESGLPKERVERAKKEAAQEIFRIHLSELRKSKNIRQVDVDSFSQSSLSKIESRKDIKISTLIEYIKSIGMRLEIKAYPKHKRNKKDEIILVKT